MIKEPLPFLQSLEGAREDSLHIVPSSSLLVFELSLEHQGFPHDNIVEGVRSTTPDYIINEVLRGPVRITCDD